MATKYHNPLPVDLPHLSPTEAVLDTIYRILYGIDNYDLEVFKSGLTKDAIFIVNGQPQEGRDAIIATTFELVGPLTSMHLLTNPRVYLESENTAQLTANVMSQHFPPGGGFSTLSGGDGKYFLAGSAYLVNLVKDKTTGRWLVKHWDLKRLWAQGDPTVFQQKPKE